MFEGQVFQFTVLPFGMSLFVEFYQTDGRYSSALASTCHLGISVPRRLAYKRSNLQSATISHNILPSNCTKSRFYSKSKEVRFDTSPEPHFIGMEFLTQQNIGYHKTESILYFWQSNCFFLKLVSARTSLSLLVKLSAAADIVLQGRLHLRPLQMYLLSVWRPHDSIPFEMVDGHQSLRPGSVHSSSGTQYIPFHGCQSF